MNNLPIQSIYGPYQIGDRLTIGFGSGDRLNTSWFVFLAAMLDRVLCGNRYDCLGNLKTIDNNIEELKPETKSHQYQGRGRHW